MWKEINGYEVNELGEVRRNGRLLKCWICKGYKQFGKYRYFVHRIVALAFIPNPDNLPCIDHINNIKDDNRVENLRWANKSQNAQNMTITSQNTSGIKGVSWKKDKNRWKAFIGINNKEIHIGYYKTIEEATEARQSKARELFGEFCHKSEQ